MLLSHVDDLAKRAEHTAQLTAYLTPAEQREIADSFAHLGDSLVFWGGTAGADRRRALILPDWLRDSAAALAGEAKGSGGASWDGEASRDGEGTRGEKASQGVKASQSAFSPEREELAKAAVELASMEDEFPALLICASDFVSLTHRDYLGAVMNLGLERSTLGDIFTLDQHRCVMFCSPLSASVVEGELKRVGRDSVRISRARTLPPLTKSYEELFVTVPSMRLDCAVKALCAMSREAAQRAVESGLCELNYKTEDSPSATVAPGDIISLRGTGKFRLISVDGHTKKDRIRLSAVKYI